MKYEFPKNFWWGAATSGPQSEGRFYKIHKNIMDFWFDTSPQDFFNQIGPNVASNFYNDFVNDIALMKKIGLNSVRTSIQWTRFIKNFETAEVDENGLKFYNAVIDEFLKHNIIPVINLHHFDLPIELYEKYGGWESKKVVDFFVKFAEKCFENFGDRVKNWITFNEPMVIVEGGYLYQFHYPKIIDGKKACQVIFNLNLASSKVIEIFRKNNFGGGIGIILNLTPVYPRTNSAEDIFAANFAELFKNKSFLDTAVFGKFPEKLVKILERDGVIWNATAEELEIIKKNTIDYLGVNYYHPCRVKSREKIFEFKSWLPEKYFENYEMPNARMNPYRGWEIYPQAIYDIAKNIRENYKNISWYVAENGMGVEGEEKFKNSLGFIEDDYRVEFLKEHLEFLHKGIMEGSNCFGFHAWTGIDCWSWSNAYKNRYGFISVDLATQIKTIKKSGYWIKKVAENNGFD